MPPRIQYIVKLEAGALYLCCPYPGMERPKSFAGPGLCIMRKANSQEVEPVKPMQAVKRQASVASTAASTSRHENASRVRKHSDEGFRKDSGDLMALRADDGSLDPDRDFFKRQGTCDSGAASTHADGFGQDSFSRNTTEEPGSLQDPPPAIALRRRAEEVVDRRPAEQRREGPPNDSQPPRASGIRQGWTLGVSLTPEVVALMLVAGALGMLVRSR